MTHSTARRWWFPPRSRVRQNVGEPEQTSEVSEDFGSLAATSHIETGRACITEIGNAEDAEGAEKWHPV